MEISTKETDTGKRDCTFEGLYFGNRFFVKAEEYLKQKKPEAACMAAVDIEHFHLYNKIHGREEGNRLLSRIAECLREFQKNYGGVIGYFCGDNFAILTDYVPEILEQLYKTLINAVQKKNAIAEYLPAIGVFKIEDLELPAGTMYDYAVAALEYVNGSVNRICEYTDEMDERIEEKMQMLHDVWRGMAEDEFTFYIQPQCDIMKGRIVGGEALVRWQHCEKGLISPGKFIPLLEEHGMITDLDRIIWRKVCRWLRECLDKGYRPVPVSINVSKKDILSIDVPEYLNSLLDEYDLSPDLLHVEITESAYAEDGAKIIQTAGTLQKQGFVVLMDDFGNGYSSLNMLKSVPVDVIKMDMGFLEFSKQNQKIGIDILDSVINMTKQMKMPIVVEGVENEAQENHLLKMGCRYMQGYFYYKPLPLEAFEALIADPENTDHEGFWCRQLETIHIKEFLDTNLFNDIMVNNILGPAAFYDMYQNHIEITRVNEPYFRLVGMETQQIDDFHKKFWNHVRDDERQRLVSIFEQAYENPVNGASGFIHFLRVDEKVLLVYIRIFFIREKDGHQLFYASLSDMTDQKDVNGTLPDIKLKTEDISTDQMKKMAAAYNNMPYGVGIGKILLDEHQKAAGYEEVYVNKEVDRVTGGNPERFGKLLVRIFAENHKDFLAEAYRAAYLNERIEGYVYNSASSHYFKVSMYQYQYGYAGCVMQNVTDSYIYESTLQNVLSVFREVYFLQLQERYCRMIYPQDKQMLHCGDFVEVLNRHFATGKILPYDEGNIREFFDIDYLKRALKKQDFVEYPYKRRTGISGNGNEEWCRIKISVIERLESGEPKTASITIQSLECE